MTSTPYCKQLWPTRRTVVLLYRDPAVSESFVGRNLVAENVADG
jgi:hypothetical protein